MNNWTIRRTIGRMKSRCDDRLDDPVDVLKPVQSFVMTCSNSIANSMSLSGHGIGNDASLCGDELFLLELAVFCSTMLASSRT